MVEIYRSVNVTYSLEGEGLFSKIKRVQTQSDATTVSGIVR